MSVFPGWFSDPRGYPAIWVAALAILAGCATARADLFPLAASDGALPGSATEVADLSRNVAEVKQAIESFQDCFMAASFPPKISGTANGVLLARA